MVSESSVKMNNITGEISERIITANGSVTDLSAFTGKVIYLVNAVAVFNSFVKNR